MVSGRSKYFSLIIWVLALELVGWFIGLLTRAEIHTWYGTLQRSPLSPPDYVFGIVWSMLYLMIAICGWQIWRQQPQNMSGIKPLFIAQLLLNWLWSPLFFSFHQTALALICLLLMVVFVAMIIGKSYLKIPVVALLMMPYFVWLLFAGYLNFYILLNN